jgi:DNA invertase Pin-like site-specific DNA recombinase
MDNEELDIKQLRYILYARKSTDDPERQVRSIDDQIAECKLLAKRLSINVVEVITEKKSAKKPGKRPLFTQMLKDIRHGKYNAILGWNPDRLARNMKEGGEIIDMIDDDFIKDMKFVTHHFSKDANGKMLLGMAFVLSKQYSDNLSQNVRRGVRRNLAEGKSSIPKHGYIRDEEGIYRPDPQNFDLIRQAWKMRREGTALDTIANFLNEQGYARRRKSINKKVYMSKQTLSVLFRDPFYYGILIQANQQVDLRTIYTNFQPVITEQEYIEVQRLTDTKIKPYKRKKRFLYLPLKMMIVCTFCGNHMYPGASQGRSKKYLFYRCDGKYCSRNKKSIRGKVIFAFIYKFLEKGLNFGEREYNRYYRGMIKHTEITREQLLHAIHSKEGLLKNTRMQVKDISYKLLDEKNKTVREINEERLEGLRETQQRLEAEIASLKQKVTDPETERITIRQFLNLSENAARVIQSGDAIVKDAISRLIFLNLSVDEEKVTSWQLKPPFDELLKTRLVVSGREEATNLEPLILSLLTHWDCTKFDEKLLTIYPGYTEVSMGFTY